MPRVQPARGGYQNFFQHTCQESNRQGQDRDGQQRVIFWAPFQISHWALFSNPNYYHQDKIGNKMANYQKSKVCTKKIFFFKNKVQNSCNNQLHQPCFARGFHLLKGLHTQRCADFLPQQKLMCSLLKGPTRSLRCSRTQGKQQHQK